LAKYQTDDILMTDVPISYSIRVSLH